MPAVKPEAIAQPIARKIALSGRVQGIGLRPAVARWAAQCGVSGSVRNTPAGVEILVEGPADGVRRFAGGLAAHLPAAACVTCEDRQPIEPRGGRGFVIDAGRSAGALQAEVPRDVATCPQCLAEVADARDRRRGYAFTSCTACGPRYTIIESMPYERAATTMARFDLCARCRAEYEGPSDRRFHAQTNACTRCGPHVWCVDRAGHVVGEHEAAIAAAVKLIEAGQIVALRGLGGYQLLCDATSDAAVTRLRQRKGRTAKPLAVMVESLAAARRIAVLDAAAAEAFVSAANPIVVVPAVVNSGLSSLLHPGLNEIGLLLPTTPLHWLLLRGAGRPLVATSGNREGEPLTYEIDESHERLSTIADLWLHHDRPIRRPIDDSVVRIIAGKPVTLRLARGLAPLPLPLTAKTSLLALGGDQKVALALSNGAQAILGPHVGDLQDVATFDRFAAQQPDLCRLYGARPTVLVHDMHPDYAATRWAAQQSLPTVAVQHHHAHVVAGMMEHSWLEREVLGLAWDGTGYGDDGTIWGGEFLLSTAAGYRRVAHLRPFPLAGGELAIRQPWRVAVALVRDALGEEAASRLRWAGVASDQVRQVLGILDRRHWSPISTSAGRLFDGMAALILGIESSPYEGFPAMILEAACQRCGGEGYPLPFQAGAPAELDWRPMIAKILRDRASGMPVGIMAERFHRALANSILAVCSRYERLPVVLAGGVFQNRVLTELVVDGLQSAGQLVGPPGTIPPGDGGLAAGQLAVAAARLPPTDSDSCGEFFNVPGHTR